MVYLMTRSSLRCFSDVSERTIVRSTVKDSLGWRHSGYIVLPVCPKLHRSNSRYYHRPLRRPPNHSISRSHRNHKQSRRSALLSRSGSTGAEYRHRRLQRHPHREGFICHRKEIFCTIPRFSGGPYYRKDYPPAYFDILCPRLPPTRPPPLPLSYLAPPTSSYGHQHHLLRWHR